jgi:hypothetical protein
MNLGEGATLVAIARSAEEPSENGAANGNGNGQGGGEANASEPPPQ